MPDLLTHTLATYPLRLKQKKYISILLLGSILPDLFARIPDIILPHRTAIYWAQAAFHSPIASILICFLVSFSFSEKIRRSIFKYLILGASGHFFLDLFQKTLTTSYFLLFPFSFKSFSIPLIWPNDSIYLIPLFLLFNIIFLK